MLHTIDEDIDLCIEFKLNPTQLMFVKLLVPDVSLDPSIARKRSYALATKFGQEVKGINPDDLADLVGRDVIIDYNEMGKTTIDCYEINPKFARKFHLKVYPMPDALCDAYPTHFKSDGRQFLARNASAEEIAKDYLKAIKNDPEEHKLVMEDLKWAKENDAIKVGLKKFVISRYWEFIRDARVNKVDKSVFTKMNIL